MAEAGGGFRIASAYVEVKLRDETKRDLEEIRARVEDGTPVDIKTHLDGPDNTEQVRKDVEAKPAARIRSELATEKANEDVEAFKEKVKADAPAKLPVEAKDPIDEAWRARVRASIKSISKDALEIPMSPETEQYRAQLRTELARIQAASKVAIPAELTAADRFKTEVESLAEQVSRDVKANIRVFSTSIPVHLLDDTQADEEAIRARVQGSPVEMDAKLDHPNNTEAVRREIEAEPPIRIRAALALEQAGRDLTKFLEEIDKEPPAELPVEAKDPVDEAWRAKVKASIRSISKDAIQIPLVPETATFREELKLALGEIESATKQRISVDMDGADQFKLHVEALAREVSQEVKAHIQVDADEESARSAGDKIGRAASGAARSAASGGMSGMAILITSAIVAAAPLVGAALTTVVGGAFIGLAILAAHWSQDVKNSFSQLKTDVVAQMRSMTDQTAPYVQQSIHMLQAGFDSLVPSMRQAFTAAGPQMLVLTDGINKLAQNSMPGLVKAVQTGGPVFAGFRTFLADTGTALSDLMSTMSQHSSAMGTAWTSWGSIVKSVLGLAGNLIATLAEVWAAHSGQITSAISALSSVISGLASGALPVLGSAFGSVLTVATAVLHVLEPLTGVLGPLTGVLLSGAMAMKTFGLSMADMRGFFGGSSKAISDTATSTTLLGAGLAGSASSGEKAASAGSKFGAVLKGLGSALPYVGVAVAVLGTAFEATAHSTEQAAKQGEDLGKSLIKGGSEADRARQKINDLKIEGQGYQQSLDRLTELQRGAGTAAGTYSAKIEELRNKITDNKTAVDGANKSYEDTKKSLTGSELAQVKYNEAVEKYGPRSKEAAAAGEAWRAALDQDKTKADAAAESTKTFTEKIAEHQSQVLASVNAELAMANAVAASGDKQKALNDARTKFGEKSPEFQQALRDLESAQMAQADAAGKAAGAAYTGTDAQEKLKLTSSATTLELLNMAAASNGHMTPALQSAIGKLGATDWAAAGARVKVDELGRAVVTLPDGKEITIHANTAAAQGTVDSFVRANDGRVIHIRTETSTGTSTNVTGGGMKYQAKGGILAPFAAGGFFDGHALTPMASGIADMIPRNTWRVIGDNRWAKESYIPQDDSNRSKAILAQTNADMGNPLGVGSGSIVHKEISVNNYITVRDNDTAHQVAALASAGTAWQLQTMRG